MEKSNEHKLVITKQDNKVITYYLQGDCLIQASVEVESLLQNIYIGKVKNVVSNINAAFVEIKKGYICYLSLAECKNPILLNREYNGKIVAGDEIVVQICRDKIKTKEAAVTTNISISGKYLVVSYPNKTIGYSNKISLNQKKKLMEFTKPFLDKEFGYVIRTNAVECLEGSNEMDLLKKEMEELTQEFKMMIEIAAKRTPFSLLYEAPNIFLTKIRDTYSSELDKIITDDDAIFNRLVTYSNRYALPLDKLVKYEDTSYSISKLLRLDTKLAEALGKKVWLKSGGYLIIEPTEALTVIDVNTGKYSGKKEIEDTFLLTNLEAVEEIAHQLRLRNVSGMIVIDFINMKTKNHQDIVMEKLTNAVKKDPIKTMVIDITPLGLVEVTRKRIEQPLLEQWNDQKEASL